MGMFDWVDYEHYCNKCGLLLTSKDWQTKNAQNQLDVVHPAEVNNFYTGCPKCHLWIDVQVEIEEIDCETCWHCDALHRTIECTFTHTYSDTSLSDPTHLNHKTFPELGEVDRRRYGYDDSDKTEV
jgi:hypothetical protein